MKNTLYIVLAILLAAGCAGKPKDTPKDKLMKQLLTLAEEGKIAYGHQDDPPYGHAWKVEDWETDPLDRSDVKDVTGYYPLVMGFDLGDIEHGADNNLDGVPFGLIRKAALKHIERGGIVTFSWHPDNILTGGDAWDVSSDQVVKSVLTGGEKHTEFMEWLRRGADFVESLGDVAVIFRPWHENTGSWFWWGAKLCTAQDYIELFRMTWLYFVKDRGLTNLVWCYSPDGWASDIEGYMERYPGDEFVDLLGLDTYAYTEYESKESAVRFMECLRTDLASLNAVSVEHKKPMCLSETGLEGIPDPTWWTEVLYPAVKDFPVTYLLTWRNAWDKPGHFYSAWKGFENEADFKAFADLDQIVFLGE
ncbi:MAG: beta-mannosidase [Bacteroidales bacterium]|nr:beta-mannosidase [Bacteroidales bacterium]